MAEDFEWRIFAQQDKRKAEALRIAIATRDSAEEQLIEAERTLILAIYVKPTSESVSDVAPAVSGGVNFVSEYTLPELKKRATMLQEAVAHWNNVIALLEQQDF